MPKPKTIGQYCIMRWLEANFHVFALKVEFTSANTAKVTDRSGDSAVVVHDNGKVYLSEENETPGAATPGESE